VDGGMAWWEIILVGKYLDGKISMGKLAKCNNLGN
jgi:hypothetical protein